MAWFRKDRKKKRTTRDRLEIPPDAWDKCEACAHVDITENFERNLQVCPGCGHHRKLAARGYVELMMDPGTFRELYDGLRSTNPLTFEGYDERLERAHRKVGRHDAIITGHGTLAGMSVGLAVMDFTFMGGSMGSVVGEKITRLIDRSLEKKEPLVIISASGGARMQEGVLSLMQLAKTSAMIAELKERAIPYISIMTNPTTGGVSASYAMQGDVHLAEPGAVIGFAGPRVIKQTIGQDLPNGFQTAEFLLDHGMVDAVVRRDQLKPATARLLAMMMGRKPVGETV